MVFIFLIINVFLIQSTYAFTSTSRDHEVAKGILEVLVTPRNFAIRNYELSPIEKILFNNFLMQSL